MFGRDEKFAHPPDRGAVNGVRQALRRICLLLANAVKRAYASGGRKRSSREPD